MRGPILFALSCLFVALTLGALVHQRTYRGGIEALAATGALRVEQAAERILGQVAGFRILVNLLAESPEVVAALKGEAAAAQETLDNATLKYGADHVWLVDRRGAATAASAGAGPVPDDRAALAAAFNGRLGLGYARAGGERRFLLSRGAFDGGAPAIGAVLMTVGVAALEFEWGIDPEAVGFFRGAEIVAANRQALLTREDWATRLSPGGEGPQVVRFPAPDGLPAEALVIAVDVPGLGLTARGFFDTAPARAAALLQALLAGALVLLAGLTAGLAALWRRRMADRLAIETEANARLEARVEERTAELRATQHQLVQASKMTALGQMSAGISHEVNQPLAALMNFAGNGAKLLDRGRAEDARANFGLISEQAQRISRIIRNLRGFARGEEGGVGPVDLVAAVEEALALMRPGLEKSPVRVEWTPPAGPVVVSGGAVRLQQVVVNLVTNALDAAAASPDPLVAISVSAGQGGALLSVRDNGPGVAEPSRVFEPFYSTKELGASKGLGLGLSVSYGIIGSFGGDISCRNHPGGGAVFEVVLPLAAPAEETP